MKGPTRTPSSTGEAPRPGLRWVYARPTRVLALGFGSGLLRPGPGTWGTLVGWLLWVAVFARLPDALFGPLFVLAFVLGCWFTGQVAHEMGRHDPSAINWDEIVAIWLVLWLLPPTFVAQLVGVVLFRAFDILKPFPVRYFDRHFKNGFGIMIDDIVAALCALLVAVVLIRLGVLS